MVQAEFYSNCSLGQGREDFDKASLGCWIVAVAKAERKSDDIFSSQPLDIVRPAIVHLKLSSLRGGNGELDCHWLKLRIAQPLDFEVTLLATDKIHQNSLDP